MSFELIEITAFLASAICLWGAMGLVPHLLRPQRKAAFWFSMCIILLLAQGIGRASYWDLMSAINPDWALSFKLSLGGQNINNYWNGILGAAGLSLLKLLHVLIPEADRKDYSLMTAPIYPLELRLSALLRSMRANKDRDDDAPRS